MIISSLLFINNANAQDLYLRDFNDVIKQEESVSNFVYIFDAPFKYWAREIVWKIASNADAFFAFTNCVYVKAQYISIEKFKAFYIFKSFFQ